MRFFTSFRMFWKNWLFSKSFLYVSRKKLSCYFKQPWCSCKLNPFFMILKFILRELIQQEDALNMEKFIQVDFINNVASLIFLFSKVFACVLKIIANLHNQLDTIAKWWIYKQNKLERVQMEYAKKSLRKERLSILWNLFSHFKKHWNIH